MKKTEIVDPLAMKRLNASKLSKNFKGLFESMFGVSVRTNSEDTKSTFKWHDDDGMVGAETYVPVLTLRMVKKRILDAEDKKADRLEKSSKGKKVSSIKVSKLTKTP